MHEIILIFGCGSLPELAGETHNTPPVPITKILKFYKAREKRKKGKRTK